MPRMTSPPRNLKSVNAVREALQQLNHATAQEVLNWIRLSAHRRGVSLTSIYRALNHLVAQAEVKPLHFNDGHVRYELNNQHMHHHHFICTQCQRIQMLDVCPYQHLETQLQERFVVQYHNFEVYGLCAACHTKSQNESRPEQNRPVEINRLHGEAVLAGR